MNHTHGKSKLIHLLEKHMNGKGEDGFSDVRDYDAPNNIVMNVVIVDGMAEVQALKLHQVNTCLDFANQLCDKMFSKYAMFSQMHVVFDTYVENSLKAATRCIRQHGTVPKEYKINNSTNIKSVPLKKLLDHVRTKDALTEFLSNAMVKAAADLQKDVVVAFRDKFLSGKLTISCLNSSHEEADTKLILHAIFATKQGATSLRIFTSDTDVLVLAVNYFPRFPINTCVNLLGMHPREIPLHKLFNSLEKIML